MKRYCPIVKKATFKYPAPEPAVMDENARQGPPKDAGSDVKGFHKDLCLRMEMLSLRDRPNQISPIKDDSNDSESSSEAPTLGYNFKNYRSDDDDEEEPVAPPNTPVYEDLGFLKEPIPEAVVGRQEGVNAGAGSAPMALDDPLDFKGVAGGRLLRYGSHASMDLEDAQDFRGAAEGYGSSDDEPEPMHIGEAQDFGEAVTIQEKVEVCKRSRWSLTV